MFFHRRKHRERRVLIFSMLNLLGSVFSILIFLSTSIVNAQQIPVLHKITVEGIEEVADENRAHARATAINNGMKNAFKELLSELLSQEVLEENQKQLEKFVQTKGYDYVQSYTVMVEFFDVIENAYKVVLDVSLFKGALRKNLADKGLLFKGRSIQKVLVIIDEKKTGVTFNYTNFWANKSIAEEVVKRQIEERGIIVISRNDMKGKVEQSTVLQAVNGNRDAASHLGIRGDAEVVVIGNAVSKKDIMEEEREGKIPLKASLRLTAVRSDTGETMVTVNDYADAIVSSEAQGNGVVLAKVGKKVAGTLLDKIIGAWEK